MIENIGKDIIEEIARLHLIVDKMGICIKGHITAQFQDGEKSIFADFHAGNYDRIVKGMVSDFQHQDWEQLAINATFLWYLDWSTFLGRDFLAKGDAPENFKLN